MICRQSNKSYDSKKAYIQCHWSKIKNNSTQLYVIYTTLSADKRIGDPAKHKLNNVITFSDYNIIVVLRHSDFTEGKTLITLHLSMALF